MIVEPGKTYIGKVRATSNERDTLALQLRLGSTLSATNLHPPGLPARAILCIRKFRDPLPGSLHLQRTGMRPPHAWEQAVLASLKQLAEHAAHPARYAVPSNAEAVIFADRAEMLACLASDWCEGNISARWWWQGLFRGKDIGQLLVPTWLETPAYIPAALQHLATRGKAVPFVRALRESDVHTMLRSIIRSFALYELQVVQETVAKEPLQAEPWRGTMLQSPTSSQTASFQHETQERGTSAIIQPTIPTAATRQSQPVQPLQFRVAPWQAWIPEISSSELRLEQQSLLGIGLMLMRAPTAVRTSSFAQAVLQWWRAEHLSLSNGTSYSEKGPATGDAPPRQRPKSSSASSEHPREVPVFVERARDTRMEFPYLSGNKENAGTSLESIQFPKIEPVEHLLESAQFTTPEPVEPSFESTHFSASEPVEHLLKSAQFTTPEPVEPVLESSRFPAPEPVEPSFESIHSSAPEPVEQAHESIQLPTADSLEHSQAITQLSIPDAVPFTIDQEQPGAVELLEAEIETELGGLFYLINLGLFLNLYGDFTTPLQPGLSLSIWDFIALLGQQLLGTKADPVWLFLAQLAGRNEQEPAGKDFNQPDSWRVPAEWLTPFPEEGTWRWSVNNGRLQVQHPEQFLVLDLPLGGSDPVEQLLREMQTFTDLRHSEVSLVNDLLHDEVSLAGILSLRVERWLRWLIPYVRVRLQRALGLVEADDVGRILCEHTARISLTATHLDIEFSLAELPIEVRLSGLDRNPGWVPAAGRFIAFHFE